VSVKFIRINADANGIPCVFYKYDIAEAGWYPKPIEITSETEMQRIFKHDDPEFGEVLSYKEFARKCSGIRQTWFYGVTYANNEVVSFLMKCISLPMKHRDFFIDLNVLLPQIFRGKIVDETARETIFKNIIHISLLILQ